MGSRTKALVSGPLSRVFAVFGAALVAAACQLAQVAAEQPEVKRVRVNGADLAYVEQGRGTPVVFVHGSAGDWRIWEFQRPAVSSRYRFVAYSRRYHWPSTWAGDGKDYSQPVHVDDLVGFLKAIGAGPVVREAVSSGNDIRAAELMVDAALGRAGAAQQLPSDQRT